jgi:hypothetical protein
LLTREVARFRAFVEGPDYPMTFTHNDQFTDLVNDIVARAETLRRLFLVGARWGTDESFSILLRALAALDFSAIMVSGQIWQISLRQLAASLCFYWSIGASLLRRDFNRVASLMNLSLAHFNGKRPAAINALPLTELERIEWKVLKGFERNYTPHSDFFSPLFIAEANDIVVGSADAEGAWDDTEFVIGMEFTYRSLQEHPDWVWVPVGRFMRLWQSALPERLDRMGALDAASPELQAGLFGGTTESAKATLESAREKIRLFTSRMH